MNNFFSNEPVSLEPDQFKESPGTYALALVVRDETEAQRVTEGGRLLSGVGGVPLGLLGNTDLWVPANFKRWYEFLASMEVLERCAKRLGVSLVIVTERAYKELSPPNWQTLFWMHAFLETLGDSLRAQAVLERRVKEAGEQAILALAKKGSDRRHMLNRESREKVFAWCDENMERFKSMDDAALDIAETFVPQKFRAVREWMTEWKKLRSAGTP